MLACGIGLPPWADQIIGVTIVLWFVSAAVAIPNLIMSSRAGQSAVSASGNFVLFIAYAGLSVVLWSGLAANYLMVAIPLFLFVPGMVIGHFGYLVFMTWRERRARKLQEQDGHTGSLAESGRAN
jgi:hypothetical protein